MLYFRIIFLLSVALMSSGYRWRCYIFCDDQTGIQNDYIDNRDTCRNYAQENLEKEMGILGQDINSAKSRQATLVKIFSDCMAKYGWDVPAGSGGDSSTKVAKNEVPLYVATVSKAAPTPVVEQKDITPLITPKPASCAKPSKKATKKSKDKNRKAPKKQPDCDTTTTTDKNTNTKSAPKQQPEAIEKPTVEKPAPAKIPATKEPAKPTVLEKQEAPAEKQPPADVVKTEPAKLTPPEETKKPATDLPPATTRQDTVTTPNPTKPTAPETKNVAPAPAPAAPPAPQKAEPPPTQPLSDAAIDLLDSQLKPSFWQR